MGLKSLIDVKVVGAPENSDGTVVIKNFFKDPLTKKVLDIQFQRVSMEEKINIGVPIEFVGTAPGEKEGGILEHTIDELEVTCLPKDIPASIQIECKQTRYWRSYLCF